MVNLILRNSEKFFCKKCSKFFDEAKFYNEKHGLSNPPYERVAVCSRCGSDSFVKFNLLIEKKDVADWTLSAIMLLNRYTNALKDIYGTEINNCDLKECTEIMVEAIVEMFDFIGSDIQKQIFEMCSEGELKRVLLKLKGEL